VAIAEWHRREFERAEDGYTAKDFFRVQFLDAFGHSDGVFLQLAAAFDAFACAIAHKVGLSNPDKADFASSNALLVTKTGGDLGTLIESTAVDPGFTRLISYRNVAAHRSVTTPVGDHEKCSEPITKSAELAQIIGGSFSLSS